MIPTVQEWLDSKEFAGYEFGPAVLFDGGTQVAVAIALPGGLSRAMRAGIVFRSDTTDVVRRLKLDLVAWAKGNGH